MEQRPGWTLYFPGLDRLESTTQEVLAQQARHARAPGGAMIFGQGQDASDLLLLIDGSVRVQQLSETGREIVLYRVRGGESCFMTTGCLLAHEAYSAEG